jgi:hypothetical protein
MTDEALAERCRALKLLLSDVIEAILRARGDWERVRAAVGASVGSP